MDLYPQLLQPGPLVRTTFLDPLDQVEVRSSRKEDHGCSHFVTLHCLEVIWLWICKHALDSSFSLCRPASSEHLASAFLPIKDMSVGSLSPIFPSTDMSKPSSSLHPPSSLRASMERLLQSKFAMYSENLAKN